MEAVPGNLCVCAHTYPHTHQKCMNKWDKVSHRAPALVCFVHGSLDVCLPCRTQVFRWQRLRCTHVVFSDPYQPVAPTHLCRDCLRADRLLLSQAPASRGSDQLSSCLAGCVVSHFPFLRLSVFVMNWTELQRAGVHAAFLAALAFELWRIAGIPFLHLSRST